jgi:uncharacterized protein (TIGR03083 family)
MIDSLTPAARLSQTDPDQAHAVAHAEGRATLELLRTLGDDDWARPTDCTDWDVRALVAHLVAQCQDGLHLASMLRRELLRRRRYPDKPPVDAYMAVGVDDHRAASGPQLVERFASLWPRAARARRRRPAVLRRIKLDPGIPGQPRWRLDYLLDVIYNRDLWLHRVDLVRATGRPLVLGDHDRQIVAQVVRDLGRGWSAALDLVSGQASAHPHPPGPSRLLIAGGYAFACCKELRQISAHASCSNAVRMSARRS